MPGPGTAAGVSQDFGRARRLRASRDFRRVSKQGRRASSRHFVLLAADQAETSFDGCSRVGLTVSRRVGNAVVRNRVKRRLRSWFREGALRETEGVDWVVIARASAAGLDSASLRTDLDALGSRLLGKAS